MITRALFFSNKFFQSNFKYLKQGYVIPKPPSKPETERQILIKQMKNSNLLQGKVKDINSLIKDKNYATEQRNEAQIIREQQVKEHEKQKQKYESDFSYPKKNANAFSQFIKAKYEQGLKGKANMKDFSEQFKNLPQNEKDTYEERAKQDHQRFQQEKQSFEERNIERKVPMPYKITGYVLFIQEQAPNNRNLKLSDFPKLWKELPEEKKLAYSNKADEMKKQQKQAVLQFQKKHNISEQDMEKIFKKRSKSSKKDDNKIKE